MKSLLIALCFIACSIISFGQKRPVHKSKPRISVDKYHDDDIDNRMKGPHGEAIHIGANGGRYYMKNGNKIYVEYKGNKKK